MSNNEIARDLIGRHYINSPTMLDAIEAAIVTSEEIANQFSLYTPMADAAKEWEAITAELIKLKTEYWEDLK